MKLSKTLSTKKRRTMKASKASAAAAAVGALVFAVTAGAASSGPPDTGVIVLGESVGAVEVGDSRLNVEGEWGRPDSTGGTGDRYFLNSGGYIVVYFSSSFSNATVDSFLVVDADGYETDRGIGTGDFENGDYSEVSQAYPEANTTESSVIVDGAVFRSARSFSGDTDSIGVNPAIQN